jgi:hypothetical protein
MWTENFKVLISFSKLFLNAFLQLEAHYDFGFSFPQLDIDEEKRQYFLSQASNFIGTKQPDSFQNTIETLYKEHQLQQEQV